MLHPHSCLYNYIAVFAAIMRPRFALSWMTCHSCLVEGRDFVVHVPDSDVHAWPVSDTAAFVHGGR